MIRKILFCTAAASLLSLAACAAEDNSGQAREQRAQQTLTNQAAVTVGVPAITNFTEKRILKMIYELRDNPNLVTYSYYLDRDGNRHKLCPTTSVGYGFPYATQFTAPHAPRIAYPLWPDGSQSTAGGHTYDADQPEPNGLYMPSTAEGTWVVCLAPDGKNLSPIYVEPRVIVSQFPLKAVD